MTTVAIDSTPSTGNVGGQMYGLIRELYPICRSITGDGVRKSLQILQRRIPLEVREVSSGTPVFDWKVPKEWNIRDAYIKDSSGNRVVDFQKCNLHVVSYSVPVRAKLTLQELKKHLFTLPEHPDWIPYRTSYYKEDWGFCLSHKQLEQIADGIYEVVIDSSLVDGSLLYGECYLRGEVPDEVLISCHICHPSLCNDNLSGVALATQLAQHVASVQRRYSYRFLFVPGTIGSITWLALNEGLVSRIKHGLVVVCVGDPGRFRYKKSRRGNCEIDCAAVHVLKHAAPDHEIIDFSPYGYDERQYCSPAFNLPVGSLTRTPHGCFPEYHTSADDLEFIKPQALSEAFTVYAELLRVLENNRLYLNQNPKCEPQLGRRGLYGSIGGQANSREHEMAMLWVLNLSDGTHSLLDIAERSGLQFEAVHRAAVALIDKRLLAEVSTETAEPRAV